MCQLFQDNTKSVCSKEKSKKNNILANKLNY